MKAIALIGISGAGKSKIGRTLAARIDAPLLDVDAEIVRRTGRRIADIFATDGEAAFRALEAEVTLECLASTAVVSLGGGAPMTPAVADGLRGDSVHVVWLHVSLDVAAARVGHDPDRPLLNGEDARDRLARMLATRGATYAALADQVVEADSDDAEAKVAEIVAALHAKADA